ncbi:MAG: acyl-CoA thioesterase/BAAT N-terminal domain-containing protein, partial [Chloroflexota bacterium]
MANNPQIIVTPTRALIDTPLDIQLRGFQSKQQVTIQAQIRDGRDVAWASQALYEADEAGNLDLNQVAPISAPYEDADAMGLIWSMTAQTESDRPAWFIRPERLAPLTISFEAILNNQVVASTEVKRLFKAVGVQRISVEYDGLIGVLFLPPGDGPHPVIMQVSGSGGAWDEDMPALYASH